MPEKLPTGELAKCDYFTVWKRELSMGKWHECRSGEPIVLMFLGGSGHVASADRSTQTKFAKGETILIPASLSKPSVVAEMDSIWLEIRLGRSNA
jgi:hypothetical protein